MKLIKRAAAEEIERKQPKKGFYPGREHEQLITVSCCPAQRIVYGREQLRGAILDSRVQ